MMKKCAHLIALALLVNTAFAQSAKIGIVGPDNTDLFEKDLEADKGKVSSDGSPKAIAKRLSLVEAIESGLRKNNQQKTRNFQFELLDIEYDNAFDSFWFPNVNLVMSTDAHLVEKLFTDNSSGAGTSKTPSGYVGLEFADYTLFNWGRDYLDFLNSKQSYHRNKQRLSEQRRRLRFSIIAQYFTVAYSQIVLRSRSEVLRHSSFIYRLAREKMQLKKISSQELYQAKEEYLKALGSHREYLYKVLEEERTLAQLMGDDLTTNYKLTNELLFRSLTTNIDEAYRFAIKSNPDLLQASTDLANANRSFKKTLKDNLPLPKVSLRLGAYKHNFSNNGVSDSFSSDSAMDNKNVELVATVNMTWTIFGSRGFLNSRTKESSYLNKRIAEVDLLEAKRNISVSVNNLVRQINFLERRVESSKERLKNARVSFDKTLDNYISGKTSFVNMKTVLDSLRDSEFEFEESKLNHLIYKMELSELMGIENFPGQNFEQLVVQ